MKKALLAGLLCMSIASSASASLAPSHEQWRYIPTMEQSVCYTFGGITKTEPLQNLLISLPLKRSLPPLLLGVNFF